MGHIRHSWSKAQGNPTYSLKGLMKTSDFIFRIMFTAEIAILREITNYRQSDLLDTSAALLHGENRGWKTIVPRFPKVRLT